MAVPKRTGERRSDKRPLRFDLTRHRTALPALTDTVLDGRNFPPYSTAETVAR